MKKSESIIELAKALSKFQGEVKQPKKDAKNPFFKSTYVNLEGVVDAIAGAAPQNGLSFMQFATNEDDKIGVTTLVMHSSGEWIESDAIYAKPNKNDPQAIGSVVSYLKRYSLSAVFGITSECDDDSEVAMGRGGSNQSYQQPRQQYQPQQPQQPQQQQQQQSQQGPVMLSDAQLKALKAKLNNISKAKGADPQVIYNGALSQLGIAPTETKALTKELASKVINYLATLEGQ